MTTWSPSPARTVAIVPPRPLRGVRVAQLLPAWPSKASAEQLDFTLDLSCWMADAEDCLAAAQVAVLPAGAPCNLGIIWSTAAGQAVVLLAAGGVAGTVYQVAITVTTSIGRTGYWLVLLPVDQRSPSTAPPAAIQAPAVVVDGQGNLVLSPDGLPKFDPGVRGASWLNGGILSTSSGSGAAAGRLDFSNANLPTEDPGRIGQRWNNGGAVAVSTGLTGTPQPATPADAQLAVLPTSDPLVQGAPWLDGGEIAFSAGPPAPPQP